MYRRKWDPKLKAKIVIEWLNGKPVRELCVDYGINPSQFYKWRDHFQANAFKIFENPKRTKDMLSLEKENERLKNLVGELTLALDEKRSLNEKKYS